MKGNNIGIHYIEEIIGGERGSYLTDETPPEREGKGTYLLRKSSEGEKTFAAFEGNEKSKRPRRRVVVYNGRGR